MAAVYLMDHKPDKAVATIRDSQISGLPDQEMHERMLLEARAFAALKQWDNALASYEDALKPEGTAPGVRAYIYRGKGLVLVEMSRMAEGKIAYEEALQLTVNDPAAQRDLNMIEQLRDGGPKQPGQFAPSPAKP